MNSKVINVYNSAYKKLSIAIVHTLNGMHTKIVNSNNAKKVVNCNNACKSCHLQLCIQKLSLSIVYAQFFSGNSTYEMNDYLQ